MPFYIYLILILLLYTHLSFYTSNNTTQWNLDCEDNAQLVGSD